MEMVQRVVIASQGLIQRGCSGTQRAWGDFSLFSNTGGIRPLDGEVQCVCPLVGCSCLPNFFISLSIVLSFRVPLEMSKGICIEVILRNCKAFWVRFSLTSKKSTQFSVSSHFSQALHLVYSIHFIRGVPHKVFENSQYCDFKTGLVRGLQKALDSDIAPMTSILQVFQVDLSMFRKITLQDSVLQ